MTTLVESARAMKFAINEGCLIDALGEVFDQAEDLWSSAGSEGTVVVADRRFQIRSDFADYVCLAKSRLAGRGAGSGTTCRVLALNAAAPRRPKMIWQEPEYPERRIEAILAPTPFRVHFHGPKHFWQVYHRERKMGMQLMWGEAGVPEWDAGSPLRNFIHWEMGSQGCGLIHSGTLALDGAGILLAGEGGAGKSSTVLAGILRGMTTVGDDYVLVDTGREVTAKAIFNTLKQDTAALARACFELRDVDRRALNWQSKHELSYDEVAQGALVDEISVRAILLPRVAHTPKTMIRPAAAKEAFLALAPSGVSQIHGDRDKSFAIAAAVARKLPAFTVELGTDPDEIIDVLNNFIGSHVP